MSLFGTTSGFGTSGTSMFGSTTTDNHNPMKVPHWTSWVCLKSAGQGLPQQWQQEKLIVWEPPLGWKLWTFVGLLSQTLEHRDRVSLYWCPVPLTAPITRITWGLAYTVESESLRGGRAGSSCDQHVRARWWALIWKRGGAGAFTGFFLITLFEQSKTGLIQLVLEHKEISPWGVQWKKKSNFEWNWDDAYILTLTFLSPTRILKWHPLLMIALVVYLLAHQPCQGTFLLQDRGLTM